VNVLVLAGRGEKRSQFEDVLWEIIGEFVGTAQGSKGEPTGARRRGQPRVEAPQDEPLQRGKLLADDIR